MLIIEIIVGNLPLITALNGGVTPQLEAEQTYFVVRPGEVNRIVNRKGLKELTGNADLRSVVRKVYFI